MPWRRAGGGCVGENREKRGRGGRKRGTDEPRLIGGGVQRIPRIFEPRQKSCFGSGTFLAAG